MSVDLAISYLNTNGSAVTAVATTVLAIITVALWIENRALRKAGSSPQMVAYLRPDPDGTGGIHFVLSNVGTGAALDVEFEIIADFDDFREHKVLFDSDEVRSPISAIPQGVEFPFLFGISFDLARNQKDEIVFLKPFKVQMAYKDTLGGRRTSVSKIDLRQFSGLPGILAKSAEKQMADSLAKIEKHLSANSNQRINEPKQVVATSIADRLVRWLTAR